MLGEVEDLLPCVGAGRCPVGEGAVEERVGRAVVDDHRVGPTGASQPGRECLEVGDGCRSVGSGDEQQERSVDVGLHIGDGGGAAVEADATGQVEVACGQAP
jgi:hypothetical protein